MESNALGKKVCLLTDSDVFAGTEQHILDLAIALRDLGCIVTVAAPRAGILAKRAHAEGLSIWAAEKRGKFGFSMVEQLARALRARQFDFVHAHNGRTIFIGVLASLRARRGKIIATQHFIVPAHAIESGCKGWVKHKIHVWLNTQIAKIIAVSTAVAEGMAQRGESRKGQVVKVGNGIRDPARDDFELNAVEGIAGNASRCILICPARLEVEKGHKELIAALSLLNRRTKAWGCLMVGEGALRPVLESQVRESGLEQQVKFLGYRENAIKLMAAADIVVLAAPLEPFGLVFVEAMALSKAVIAMAAGGPLDIIEHEKTGLLVPPGDTTALATALQRMIEDPTFRRQAGQEGRKRFLRYFTAKKMAEQTLKVYEEAIGWKGDKR